ncbi:MAG TPA: hypothetical protein VJL90_11125 [Pseudorhodoplanes sp.]|nr:hypothetical protein [Pseudorhodoplanes sp.]
MEFLMSQTAKKETVFFLAEDAGLGREEIGPNGSPLRDGIAARQAIFSGRSHAFEAAR